MSINMYVLNSYRHALKFKLTWLIQIISDTKNIPQKDWIQWWLGFFSVPQRPGYAVKSKERRRYPYLEVYLSFSECLDRASCLQWMLPCCCVCIFVYCILVYLFLQLGLCLYCTSSKCRTFTTVFSVSCALVHTRLVIDPFI